MRPQLIVFSNSSRPFSRNTEVDEFTQYRDSATPCVHRDSMPAMGKRSNWGSPVARFSLKLPRGRNPQRGPAKKFNKRHGNDLPVPPLVQLRRGANCGWRHLSSRTTGSYTKKLRCLACTLPCSDMASPVSNRAPAVPVDSASDFSDRQGPAVLCFAAHASNKGHGNEEIEK